MEKELIRLIFQVLIRLDFDKISSKPKEYNKKQIEELLKRIEEFL